MIWAFLFALVLGVLEYTRYLLTALERTEIVHINLHDACPEVLRPNLQEAENIVGLKHCLLDPKQPYRKRCKHLS